MISSKLGAEYVAFDLNPTRVRQSRAQGFPVYYGDGTEPEVLKMAGLEDPKVRRGGGGSVGGRGGIYRYACPRDRRGMCLADFVFGKRFLCSYEYGEASRCPPAY